MQLSWNYNYGQFSNVFNTSVYDSKLIFLNDPDQVAQDGYIAMAAGIWFYMTPQDPKPSMHDLVTGFFVPNSVDTSNSIGANFASTTNVINGALECGQGIGGSGSAAVRAGYYANWLNYFNLSAESDTDCGNQPN